MKKSELKEYIKGRIKELVTVDVSQDPGQLTPAQKRTFIQNLRTKEKNTKIGSQDNPVEFIEELNLDEMARQAAVLKVASDFREKAKNIQTGGPISPKKLEDILNFLDGKTEITGPAIAAGVGFEGKMPRIYPIYAALINVGALESTEKEKTEDIPETPENEDEDIEDILDPEDTIEDEGEDEFEKEPEAKDVEKAAPIKMDPVSQAAGEFISDNDRLIQSIINNYKESRSRLGAIREEEGDLSAADYKKALKKSKELATDVLVQKIDSLVDKIKGLEPAVQDKILASLEFKFKSVNADYLSKVVAKKLGKTVTASAPEKQVDVDIDVEDIDDEIMEDTGVEDVSYEPTFKDYENVYEVIRKALDEATDNIK